jgi:hypothetical protein
VLQLAAAAAAAAAACVVASSTGCRSHELSLPDLLLVTA